MYRKIRRTENAIAGLITMLEILTMNTNVLMNLSRLNSWPKRNMLEPISKMVNDLEEMVQKTNCLEILRNWANLECLGNWEDEEDGIWEPCKCNVCSGAVDTAQMNYKAVNRRIKEIRNFMEAYSVFAEVPTKELTARNLQ
tara:strand:+ start:270 stop:692 length:423 start_codon:yes stop_codon:yes gene_type:complete